MEEEGSDIEKETAEILGFENLVDCEVFSTSTRRTAVTGRVLVGTRFRPDDRIDSQDICHPNRFIRVSILFQISVAAESATMFSIWTRVFFHGVVWACQ